MQAGGAIWRPKDNPPWRAAGSLGLQQRDIVRGCRARHSSVPPPGGHFALEGPLFTPERDLFTQYDNLRDFLRGIFPGVY